MEPAPCPDRIIDDMGSAFCMGAIGGGVWHSVKGLKNSPRGERVAGMMHSVKLRSPALGGAFAAFGGIFSALDCAFVNIRKKEDPWNAIMSGAGASAILAARGIITLFCFFIFKAVIFICLLFPGSHFDPTGFVSELTNFALLILELTFV